MELRPLGRTGVRVSELCLGTMTFGNEADEATSQAIVDRFLDAGGNFVDTANVYSQGVSEEITGRALKAHRDNVVLATKVRFQMGDDTNSVGLSRRNIRTQVEASLRRLGTEWIDLYQVHCWDARTPLEETLSTLNDLVHEGKVRYIGASNFAGWHLAKALGISALHDWEPFVSLQPEYSLITRDLERELLPLCQEEGLAVLPWSPLGGGVLTGKYTKDADMPAGTRGAETENPITFTYRLDDRAWNVVDAVKEVVCRNRQVGGTGGAQLGRQPPRDHRADHRRPQHRPARRQPRRGRLAARRRAAQEAHVGERLPARLPVRVHPVLGPLARTGPDATVARPRARHCQVRLERRLRLRASLVRRCRPTGDAACSSPGPRSDGSAHASG